MEPVIGGEQLYHAQVDADDGSMEPIVFTGVAFQETLQIVSVVQARPIVMIMDVPEVVLHFLTV